MKNKLLIFFLTLSLSSHAQSDSLKVMLYDFLISTKDLSEYSKTKKTLLIINDIVSFEDLKNQDYGIYKFGTLTSHSYLHILLKDKSNYTIVDMHQPLEDILFMVMDYIKRKSTYNKEKTLAYLDAVLKLYQTNKNSIPWIVE